MRRRLHHLRRGLRLGYPLCCILTYVCDPRVDQAKRRGVVRLHYRANGKRKQYVPCAWHRGRHPCWEPLRGRTVRATVAAE